MHSAYMRISQQARYAVSSVFDLAYNGQGNPVQVRVISKRQRIPLRFLEQIFQRLRKAGVIEGKRGPGGGYVLSHKPEDISLLTVLEAVEGRIATESELGQANDSRADFRPRFVWGLMTNSLRSSLEQITIESLVRRAAREAVPRSEPGSMYFI